MEPLTSERMAKKQQRMSSERVPSADWSYENRKVKSHQDTGKLNCFILFLFFWNDNSPVISSNQNSNCQMKSKIFLDKPSFCSLFTQKGATVDVALPRSQHQRGCHRRPCHRVCLICLNMRHVAPTLSLTKILTNQWILRVPLVLLWGCRHGDIFTVFAIRTLKRWQGRCWWTWTNEWQLPGNHKGGCKDHLLPSIPWTKRKALAIIIQKAGAEWNHQRNII